VSKQDERTARLRRRGNDANIKLETLLNEVSTPQAGGDWPRRTKTIPHAA